MRDFKIFEFAESIRAMLISISWQALQPIGYQKDPTIWLYGARPPPKYFFKNNMNLTNSKIQPTHTVLETSKFLSLLNP